MWLSLRQTALALAVVVAPLAVAGCGGGGGSGTNGGGTSPASISNEGTASQPKDISGQNPYSGTVVSISYYVVTGLIPGMDYTFSLSNIGSNNVYVPYPSGPTFDSTSAGQACIFGTSDAGKSPTANCGRAFPDGKLYVQVASGSGANTFTLTFTPGTLNGGGPGVLSVIIDAPTTLPKAVVQGYLYGSGQLVGILGKSAINFGLLTELPAGQYVTPVIAASPTLSSVTAGTSFLGLQSGTYTLLLWADLNGNGTYDAGVDAGFLGTATVSGNATLTVTDANLQTLVNQPVTISSFGNFTQNGTFYCWFAVGGTNPWTDASQINSYTYGTINYSNGTGTSSTFKAIIPSPGYDLLCLAETDGDFTLTGPLANMGDYTKTTVGQTVTGSTLTVNGASGWTAH